MKAPMTLLQEALGTDSSSTAYSMFSGHRLEMTFNEALDLIDKAQRDAWEHGVRDGLALRGGPREFPPVFPGDRRP